MPNSLQKDVLFDRIPSQNVRDYIDQTGWTPTDFERAALWFQLVCCREEVSSHLRAIAAATDNAALARQIRERLAADEEMICRFRQSEGFVYAVRSHEYEDEPYISGYFQTAEAALAHGRSLDYPFDLKKFRVGHSGDEPEKLPGTVFLAPVPGEALSAPAGWDEPVATLYYDKAGNLTDIWSTEIAPDAREHLADNHRFENTWLELPNPFAQGDIVRVLTEDGKAGHAVVFTSQEDWREMNRRAKSELAEHVDFFDSHLTLYMIYEDGGVGHEHISPLYLERWEPTKEDPDAELLFTLRDYACGHLVMEFFLDSYDRYQRYLQQTHRAGIFPDPFPV